VLETSTGRVRWSLELGSPLERFVGTAQAANGDLLCCQQGEIQVLDAKTGVLKDRQRLEVIANTRPVVFDSMVIFGCPTGEVLAHNLNSGYKQWGHKLLGAIIADPVRIGDNVAAVSSGGEVVILDPRRGMRIGAAKVFGGTDANPAASERSVFIASLDQSLWSFDQFGGPARWRERTEFPLRQDPAYHDGSVYVAIPGQGLVCFNSEDGSRTWTAAGLSGEVVGVRGGQLIVWDGKVASTVDMQRGDVVARVNLPGIKLVMTDAFVDGNLYTSTAKGEVSKFSPRK
jgi:outer membrane protein assembly factor BamB